MSCCPQRPKDAKALTIDVSPAQNSPQFDDAVFLKGGRTLIGTNDSILPDDGEKPARWVRVKPFLMDRATVTVDRFAEFVSETGYVTEAETFGWSYVFHAALDDAGRYDRLPGAEWWCAVPGASWYAPEGEGSTLDGRGDHPVVHVSWNDARAFSIWAGGRLPTEAEWEYAARGGLEHKRFPWGDREPDDTGFLPCNIWQGEFPTVNTVADGHLLTAPARSYEPNGYGLLNTVGNVWEWTSDTFRIRSLRKQAKLAKDAAAANRRTLYVLKGGSYLCHRSYCYRYRVAARTGNTPDSSTAHTGFRLAYDAS